MYIQRRPDLPLRPLSGSIRRSEAPPALTALVQTYVGVLLFVPASFAVLSIIGLVLRAVRN